MNSLNRQFKGGAGKDTGDPKLIYRRERANYQSREIWGLSANYITNMGGLCHWIDLYKHDKKEEYLTKALNVVSKMKSYRERLRYDKAIRNEKLSENSVTAIFAEDALPYIQAIDEMALEMKSIALQIKSNVHKVDTSVEINRLLGVLLDRAVMIGKIISPEIDRHVRTYSYDNYLQTDPLTLRYLRRTCSEPEALELIKKRIEYAKSVLKTGPLPRSFSYLRNDGHVTPVDWEATEEERGQLRDSGEKSGLKSGR